MLADIYKDDDEKLESIYRKALKTEKLNFDAWLGLVNLYEKDDQKTEEEYYALAKEIAETYTYYPHPMYDLLNLINRILLQQLTAQALLCFRQTH